MKPTSMCPNCGNNRRGDQIYKCTQCGRLRCPKCGPSGCPDCGSSSYNWVYVIK